MDLVTTLFKLADDTAVLAAIAKVALWVAPLLLLGLIAVFTKMSTRPHDAWRFPAGQRSVTRHPVARRGRTPARVSARPFAERRRDCRNLLNSRN